MAGRRPPINNTKKKNNSGKNKKGTPKHWPENPVNLQTTIQKVKYRRYKQRKALKGEPALGPKEWYNKVYKPKKKD